MINNNILRIAICGVDGSGKSTLIKNLLRRIAEKGIPVSTARVPFYTKDIFREIGLNDDNLTQEQELIKRTGMAFDFIKYYNELELFEGILICDRYNVDFEVLHDVYCLEPHAKETLKNIYKQAPSVDLYVYLNLNYEVASARLEARGDRKENESDDILYKMQKAFEIHFSHLENVLWVDAMLTENEIEEKVLSHISNLWRLKND